MTDTNIRRIRKLSQPKEILNEYPNKWERDIDQWRSTISRIIRKEDPRTLIIVGPCSIHDVKSAREYADRIRSLTLPNIFIVMRCYFEKPRTTVGWKGLCNDPHLDSTYDIEHGLRLARGFLIYCANIGLPVGCEFS